jgi:ArsR family transcriptional regulator, arsenate/arsenite/antimonite-responsive transcriptional repressor
MSSSEIPEETCCASVLAAPLAEADADDLARVFAALGDPVRLRLLSLVADAGEICSCDLEQPLGKSQPTVSHHTKVLADVGLVVGEKRGRWVWWRIVPERMAVIRAALEGAHEQRAVSSSARRAAPTRRSPRRRGSERARRSSTV